MSISELNEKRKASLMEARKIIDLCGNESREITAEEEARFDAFMDEHAKAEADIRAAKRIEELDKAQAVLLEPTRSVGFSPEVRGELATSGGGSSSRGSLEYAEEFRRYMWSGERRTLSLTGDGAVVPDDMLARLIEYRNQTNVMATYVQSETFPNDVSIPKELTKPALAGFIGEGVVAEDVEGTFGAADVGAYKQFAGTSYTVEFLQDARLPVMETVSRQLGEAHAKNLEKYQCIGSGSGEPDGIFTAVGHGGANQTTGALSYDILVDMAFADHPPQYLAGAAFCMHQSTWAEVMKLQDGNSRPLIDPATVASLRDGAPFQILGLPVFISEFAPEYDAAATENQISLMPPEAALLAYRQNVTMLVDPYAGFTGAAGASVASNASTGKVTIFSFMRWDQIIQRQQALTLWRPVSS